MTQPWERFPTGAVGGTSGAGMEEGGARGRAGDGVGARVDCSPNRDVVLVSWESGLGVGSVTHGGGANTGARGGASTRVRGGARVGTKGWLKADIVL